MLPPVGVPPPNLRVQIACCFGCTFARGACMRRAQSGMGCTCPIGGYIIGRVQCILQSSARCSFLQTTNSIPPPLPIAIVFSIHLFCKIYVLPSRVCDGCLAVLPLLVVNCLCCTGCVIFSWVFVPQVGFVLLGFPPGGFSLRVCWATHPLNSVLSGLQCLFCCWLVFCPPLCCCCRYYVSEWCSAANATLIIVICCSAYYGV